MNRYLLLNIVRAVVVVFALTAMIALLFGGWAIPAFVLMTTVLAYDFMKRTWLYQRPFGVDWGAMASGDISKRSEECDTSRTRHSLRVDSDVSLHCD